MIDIKKHNHSIHFSKRKTLYRMIGVLEKRDILIELYSCKLCKSIFKIINKHFDQNSSCSEIICGKIIKIGYSFTHNLASIIFSLNKQTLDFFYLDRHNNNNNSNNKNNPHNHSKLSNDNANNFINPINNNTTNNISPVYTNLTTQSL